MVQGGSVLFHRDNVEMAVRTALCELKTSPWHSCKDEAVGTCQYCGRSFCLAHGLTSDDGQQICSRRVCRAKIADLARHLHYKEGVRRRNGSGYCGSEGCQADAWGQCSRCQGVFCDSHLHHRTQTVRIDGRLGRQPASLCAHCWQRQGLWARL